jgi:ribose 1,5-bisphosphokinase PhnN
MQRLLKRTEAHKEVNQKQNVVVRLLSRTASAVSTYHITSLSKHFTNAKKQQYDSNSEASDNEKRTDH